MVMVAAMGGRAAAAGAARRANEREMPPMLDMTQDLDDTPTTLPESSQWHLDNVLEKRILTMSHGTTWSQRRFVLCDDKLAICRKESDIIMEHIPLLDIERVNREQEDADSIVQKQESGTGSKLKLVMSSRSMQNSPYNRRGSLQSVADADAPDPEGCTSNLSNQVTNEKVTDKFKPRFTIDTVAEGFNGGRTYTIRCANEAQREEWISTMTRMVEMAKIVQREKMRRSTSLFQRLRKQVARVHNAKLFEVFIALVIMATFLCSVANAQLNPVDGSSVAFLLEILDTVFTCIFVVELMINMLSGWFRKFWVGEGWAWNIFDLVVVAVSVITLALKSDGRFASLRLIRAFRVVRLFRRFESLRKIVNALTASVIPVTNAFIVLGVVSSIYAIVGVQLFGMDDENNFGTFTQAVYTMFQVLTGDSWSSGIARPLFGPDGKPKVQVAVFFVSYIVIAGIFVLNVVVAILLDEFIGAVDKEKRKDREQQQMDILKTTMHRGTAIDPLLHSLSTFSSMDDLSEKIQALYSVLDANDSGGLNSEELSHGMKMLKVTPPIHFTEEDFEVMTDGRSLCNAEGEIDGRAFEVMMKEQLKQFMKRHIGARMNIVCQSDVQTETIMFMLKTLMFSDEATAHKRAHRSRGGSMSSPTLTHHEPASHHTAHGHLTHQLSSWFRKPLPSQPHVRSAPSASSFSAAPSDEGTSSGAGALEGGGGGCAEVKSEVSALREEVSDLHTKMDSVLSALAALVSPEGGFSRHAVSPSGPDQKGKVAVRDKRFLETAAVAPTVALKGDWLEQGRDAPKSVSNSSSRSSGATQPPLASDVGAPRQVVAAGNAMKPPPLTEARLPLGDDDMMQTPARAGRGGPEAERAHSHGEGCSSDEEADRVQSGDGERSPLIVPLPAPSRSTRIALMAGKPKLEGGIWSEGEFGWGGQGRGGIMREGGPAAQRAGQLGRRIGAQATVEPDQDSAAPVRQRGGGGGGGMRGVGAGQARGESRGQVAGDSPQKARFQDTSSDVF